MFCIVVVNGLVELTVLLENGDAAPNIDGGFVFDVVAVPKMDGLLLLPVFPLPAANEKVGVAFEAPKDKLPKGLFCFVAVSLLSGFANEKEVGAPPLPKALPFLSLVSSFFVVKPNGLGAAADIGGNAALLLLLLLPETKGGCFVVVKPNGLGAAADIGGKAAPALLLLLETKV